MIILKVYMGYKSDREYRSVRMERSPDNPVIWWETQCTVEHRRQMNSSFAHRRTINLS